MQHFCWNHCNSWLYFLQFHSIPCYSRWCTLFPFPCNVFFIHFHRFNKNGHEPFSGSPGQENADTTSLPTATPPVRRGRKMDVIRTETPSVQARNTQKSSNMNGEGNIASRVRMPTPPYYLCKLRSNFLVANTLPHMQIRNALSKSPGPSRIPAAKVREISCT
jgi:hypothetical protein